MANNIVMKITDYIAHLWHDTDNDIVMAKMLMVGKIHCNSMQNF